MDQQPESDPGLQYGNEGPPGPEGAIHPDPGAVPLVAALAAAAVGAGAWAAISSATGVEHGYVAWGIGLLIGMAASLTGGRGQGLAVSCALLAVVAIGSGKYLSAGYVIEESKETEREALLAQEVYDEFVTDAQMVAGLETDTELKGYMIEHGYTAADAVPDVPDDDFAYFEEEQLPKLRAASESPPTYEEWRAERAPGVEEMVEMIHMTPVEAMTENASPIDIVFVLLGLVTAYKLVAKQE